MNMNSMTEAEYLYETVIKNDYCIGCGMCAAVENSPFKIVYNSYGNVVADPISQSALKASPVKVLGLCPFSDQSKNEDKLSEIYLAANTNNDSNIGRYEACYAGYVKAGEYRRKGSSGGIIKWLAAKLLEENKIDYFIQLSQSDSADANAPLFRYKVYNKANDIINGSKSSYYPVSLIDVVKHIKLNSGRFAITGVPCFIKSLRLLSEYDSDIKAKMAFTFGIICGGMKSANQSKMIGWQLGVHPNNLIKIDFRRKYSNRPADQKIYQVWSNSDQKERFKDVNKIYGSDYGAGFFKPKACDYCDDVVSELADISVGDAWLNQFTYDPKGTSLIIARNELLNEILKLGVENGEIQLTELTANDAYKAQAGGFRHRKQGLSYRLEKRKLKNEWCPPKRVIPGEFDMDQRRKQIYDLREQISEQSHISFKKALDKNDLNIFFSEMKNIFDEYRNLNEVSYIRLFLRKLKRIVYYDVLRKYR